MLRSTQPLTMFAHWYCGPLRRYRWIRDRRFHPRAEVSNAVKNQSVRKRFYKTNKWNYVQAYKDMP